MSVDELYTNPNYARLTPANFALYCSGGKWQMAKHLALLNRKLVDVAAGRTKRLMISMPPRPQPLYSRVLMADGTYKPIGNIEIGELVMSHNGIPRKVIDVVNAGIQPILRFITQKAIPIDVADTHPLMVENRGWVEAKNINTTDKIYSIYNITTNNKNEDLTLDQAYMLGFFTAYGKTTKANKYHSQIPADKLNLRYVNDGLFVKSGKYITTTKAGEEFLDSIEFSFKTVHPLCYTLNDENFVAFICGLFTSRRLESIADKIQIVIRESILDDLTLLLENYGIKVEPARTERAHSFYLRDRQSLHYVTEMMHGRIISRVDEEFFRVPHKVKGIQVMPDSPCVCLTVEEDHSYISEGYCTHNSGKSELVSKYFPAWYLGTFPDNKVIFATYEAHFAAEFGAASRDLLIEHGLDVFGVKIKEGGGAASRWKIENNLAIMQCAGVGGPMTGKGADCVVGETTISTASGPVPMEKLVVMKDKPLVLSYNHTTNKVEYKKILATRKTISNELYTIETSSGSTIRSTGKHRFFTEERGYQSADLLRVGDTLSEKISEKQNVCQLSQRENRQRNYLQRLLRKNKKSNNVFRMRTVLRDICKTPLRVRETVKKTTKCSILLFPVLFKNAPFIQKCKKVRELSNSYAWQEKQQILFSRMYKKSVVGKKIGKDPGCLQLVVQKDASSHIGERQLQMCCMSQPGSIYVSERSSRETNISLESLHTSPRRKQRKQHSRKSFKYMYELPSNTSQLKRETIVRVTKTSEASIPVYDIQVERNSNFFANGILTHNCLIIDDPIKNDQEAESQLMRDKIFKWFGATSYTRLQPGGAIVIVMTRWHCLLPGNKVLCEKGYKNIEDIAENDLVYGANGYTRVLGKAVKPTEDTVYSFKLYANPDEITVTSDHKILTNNGWKEAKDIKLSDKFVCPKPIKKYESLDFLKVVAPGKEKNFNYEALNDPDFWYCIGIWVAEGCLTYGKKGKSANSVRYTMSLSEKNIILQIKQILAKYGVTLNYSIKDNTIQAKATNYHFARIVERFGLGALNKFIPEWIYSLDDEKLKALVQGIYVGDGCKHENYLRIASSSLSLLQGVRLCLLLLNIPSSIMYVRKEKKVRKIRGKLCNVNKSWELRFVDQKLDPVDKAMTFETIFIDEKHCYFDIKKICKQQYSGPVYDIKTESSDFLVEGILVHNCDDVMGRLIDNMKQKIGEDWEYLKFPAIANEDEKPWPEGLGRQIGEPLWPEMWPLEDLLKIKNSGALSSYYWSALYQQEPAPEGGGIFKDKWFRYYTMQGQYYILDKGDGITEYVEDSKCWKFMTVDTANKVKNTSDYTAIAVWTVTPKHDLILCHLVRARLGYEEIMKKLIALHSFHKTRYIGIENMGIAIQLIIEARNKGLPVRELEPEGKGKQNRANMPMGAVIRMESGKVFFPKHADYLSDIEIELMTFPKAAHDEIVDVLSYACNELTKIDLYDNDDFLPYLFEDALPIGMRKKGGILF